MLTRLLRVVVLLSAFSFLSFAEGQALNTVPSVVANEASARLALKEKNSLFSIELLPGKHSVEIRGRAPNVAPRCPLTHKYGTRLEDFCARRAATFVPRMSS